VPPEIVLAGALCTLRPYRPDDVDGLIAVADDPLVSRWMTAGFPSPYTRADAEWWVGQAVADAAPHNFVIVANGAFAGGVGIQPLDGESHGVALFGYWLGRAYWGRGLATDAARTLARYALRDVGLRRLEASVFAPNTVSMRVLEKAGFTLEARMRDGYLQRDGTVCDKIMYARLASDPDP
jgi:RimJ/RimL family protein N-acetyltransferase